MYQEKIVTLIIVLSAISGSLALFNVYKEKFNKSTFVLFAFTLASALIAVYLNSDHMEMTKLGNQEKFGQFGDYVGGILNPIFGFITVLLLIHTANLHKISLDDQIKTAKYNEKFRKIDTLNQILKYTHSECNQSLRGGIVLSNGKKISYEELFTVQHNLGSIEYQVLNEIIECIDCIHQNKFEKSNLYFFIIFELVKKHERLLNTYLEIFRIEDYQAAKENIAMQISNELIRINKYLLISQTREAEIRDEIYPYSHPKQSNKTPN